MELRNIIVGLDIDAVSPDLVVYACNLARPNNATVIGSTAAQPSLVALAMDGDSAAAAAYAEQPAEIERSLAIAEAQFRRVLRAGARRSDARSSWRHGHQPAEVVLRQTRRLEPRWARLV